MGVRHRVTGARVGLAGAAALAGGLACACAHPAPQDDGTSRPVAAPRPPVDHLAPGELAEGDEHAYGLALPRKVHIERKFAEVIFASGDVAIHPLAKYFRSRLQGGSLDENDTSATFDPVHMQATPGREYHSGISQTAQGARVEVRASTPPPAPNLPDEAARWRQVGLTPQGKLLDPTHVE
jgi:hypothetical protein